MANRPSSFPFMRLANWLGVPYGSVLLCADSYKLHWYEMTPHHWTALRSLTTSQQFRVYNLVRDEEVRRAAAAAAPPPPVAGTGGGQLAGADYAAIERRVLAHEQMGAVDVHTAKAMEMYGVSREQVTPAQRAVAKLWNYDYGYSATGRGVK